MQSQAAYGWRETSSCAARQFFIAS